MNNAELIKALRWCGGENNEWCVHEEYKCPLWNEDRMVDECKAELMTAAADALEAAEKRIAELEAKMPKMPDRQEFLAKGSFIEEPLSRPKEGEWIEANTRPRSAQFYCSVCHRTCYDIQPTRDKAWTKRCRYRFCPNCGARMKGEQE